MSSPHIAEQGAQLLDQASQVADKALGATRRGIEAVRDGSKQLVSKAQDASETTTDYIRQEPVKAVLIAAATGAALMGLVALLARRRD